MAQNDWAVPPEIRRTHSAWSNGGASQVSASEQEASLYFEPHSEPLATVADPPWLEGYSPQIRKLDTVTGALGPDTRVQGYVGGLMDMPQQITTVQIVLVGEGELPRVVIDGVTYNYDPLPPPPLIGPAQQQVRRFFLPRFRTQQVSRRAHDGVKFDGVAPMFMTIRAEDGVPPSSDSMQVSVLQSAYDEGAVIVKELAVLQRELRVHSANDMQSPSLLVPYPAVSPRPPTITLIDNHGVRILQMKQIRNQGNRRFQAIRNLANFFDASRGTKQIWSFSAWARTQFRRWVRGERGPGLEPWKLVAGFMIAPFQIVLKTFLTTKDYFLNKIEEKDVPFEKLKRYHFTMEEALALITRINRSTAAGITAADPNIDQNEIEEQGEQSAKEEAFFYYLLYGSGSASATAVERAITSELSQEELQRRLNGAAMVGNVLDVRAMDPVTRMASRVEYTATVKVDERLKFEFMPQRTHGVEAAWLSAGYGMLIDDLKVAIQQMRTLFVNLNDPSQANNWLMRRLLLIDGNTKIPEVGGLGYKQGIAEEAERAVLLAVNREYGRLAGLLPSAFGLTTADWRFRVATGRASPAEIAAIDPAERAPYEALALTIPQLIGFDVNAAIDRLNAELFG